MLPQFAALQGPSADKPSVLQNVTIKLDPGAITTGVALVRVEDTDVEEEPIHHVLHLGEVTHRGKAIKASLQKRSGCRQASREPASSAGAIR